MLIGGSSASTGNGPNAPNMCSTVLGLNGSFLPCSMATATPGPEKTLVGRHVNNLPEEEEEVRFKIGDWAWLNVPKTMDIKVKQFKRGQYPDDTDNTRAAVFKPRWTGPWEIDGVSSKSAVWICDPHHKKEEKESPCGFSEGIPQTTDATGSRKRRSSRIPNRGERTRMVVPTCVCRPGQGKKIF